VHLFGRLLFRTYPYQPLYHLDLARQFRAALTLPLVYVGGVTDRTGLATVMAEGFEFAAMARALLREPDLPRRLAADPTVPSLCDHRNRCVPTIYSGTRCPVRT
jgi:2,4-dienoyl-CoA reductase-like NADH-dependent reductase (Old Yellow Enzyme family)